MDNKVVYTLSRAFHEMGAPTIRFNFRGVGASAGRYEEGRGEMEDVLAVVAHGRQRWPGAALWLAGFSFGGGVAIRAARRAGAARLVSVAPAVSLDTELPDCPWLIVQAEPDDVVDPGTVRAVVRGLLPPPVLTVLPGAGHFFHGRLPELRDAVVQFISSRRTS
jgi:alpha/beta superfamily hydrolase